MAAAQPGVVGYSGSGARFQSLDDFEKEQDELQAQIDQENSNAQLTKSQTLKEMGDINWIGRLLEYHQGKGINPGPVYTEIRISEQRFACSVTIKENLEPISSLASFSLSCPQPAPSNSRNLLSHHKTPEPKKTRAPISPQAAATSTTTSPRERSTIPTSYPGLIPDLCHSLGFNIPTYKIVPMVEGIPIYQGYADFGSDPRILGRVGEFRDIHGKKKGEGSLCKGGLEFLEGY
ncbi:hypothetical protein DID88_004019 [Monilinia fructigena]|uniref:DRBM domain-containing protein n=1 Tax=Monilinia fructigena TaxID=38457 RepID=A0A395IDR3_9HELO|nr:hypothetical protein DID88_004019 [Monilinia fructigena]